MQTLATVHLVRHGEVHNPDRVLYGRLPEFGLSELGHEMARGVAAWFAERAAQTGRAPAVVAASPLTRAQQTAAPLAAAFDLPLVTEPDLIEAENAFEGMSQVAASLKRNPRLWPKLRNPLRPSWGEPYRAQAAATKAMIENMRANGKEPILKTVGAVTDAEGRYTIRMGEDISDRIKNYTYIWAENDGKVLNSFSGFPTPVFQKVNGNAGENPNWGGDVGIPSHAYHRWYNKIGRAHV